MPAKLRTHSSPAPVRPQGCAVVVSLYGDTGTDSCAWQRSLDRARGKASRDGVVIADLSGAGSVGRAGCQMLADTFQACQAAGTALRLARVPAPVAAGLARLRLPRPLPSYPTVTAALAGTHHGAQPAGAAASYSEAGPLLERLAALGAGQERQELRCQIITMCLPLAHNIAKRYAGRGEAREDLYQIACMGLVKAVDRYDVGRERNFMSFAVPTIMGEVRRYFRDSSWGVHVPRAVKEDFLRLRAASDEISHQLGRSPTVAEIAKQLAWDRSRAVKALQVANAFRPDQLDHGAGCGERGELRFADTVGSDEPGYGYVDSRLSIRPLISALPERERMILSMRFFEEMTQTQIAQELGISQMHVSRILTRTLHELRAALARPAVCPAAGGGTPPL